ncbi:MAG: polyprenyl synthetase family protein [Balneolaceae bacterium]
MSSTALQKDLYLLIEQGLEKLPVSKSPKSLYEPYKYALNVGGKRIRPFLSLLASGLCGGEPKDALPAALAVEILHNFTLVHDDIMDSAETRRGKTSVFKKWSDSVAILTGDVMFADAFQQLSFYATNDQYSKEEYAAMNQTFITATVTVCEGQALDMEFVDLDAVAITDYIQMIEGKTSALISGSLKMGAIAAHATKEQQDLLTQIGSEMGIAFQIQDDLLDAIADPEKFGKKAGGDIYEGKKTYLSLLALERANTEQKIFIQHTLAKQETSEDDVQRMLVLYDELNVINDVKKEIKNHYNNAFTLLDKFKDSSYKQELEKLLIFLQNRDH